MPWDGGCAELFIDLRQQGLPIGSMDLKIACMTLVHHATLLARNAREFTKVPGLRFENWLD